ncbi:hypothetical protein ColTof4_02925 [Colletotrichum tofieldiae]|nr:hypothetical protein ColTof4_02925 [Colletotrichum tofieldiae]
MSVVLRSEERYNILIIPTRDKYLQETRRCLQKILQQFQETTATCFGAFVEGVDNNSCRRVFVSIKQFDDQVLAFFKAKRPRREPVFFSLLVSPNGVIEKRPSGNRGRELSGNAGCYLGGIGAPRLGWVTGTVKIHRGWSLVVQECILCVFDNE